MRFVLGPVGLLVLSGIHPACAETAPAWPASYLGRVEALAVVEDLKSRKVIGLLTESHTLKRYSEELDRQRRAVLGETS